MPFLNEIIETLIYLIKEKKDTTLFFVFFICSLGWGVYQYVSTHYSNVADIHISVILIFIAVVDIFLSIITYVKISENKDIFLKMESAITNKSNELMDNWDELQQSVQGLIYQFDFLCKLCSSIDESVKGEPELKNSLDYINIRSQNVLLKSLKVLLTYIKEMRSEIKNGAQSNMAKLAAIQTANETLKDMKVQFVDDLYESCQKLSTIIKDDLYQYIDEYNMKFKGILEDDSLNCEEKVAAIIALNSALSESILSICKRHIFIVHQPGDQLSYVPPAVKNNNDVDNNVK